MATGIFRNMVLARAMVVEPVARVLCADQCDSAMAPRPAGGERRHETSRQAAPSMWTAPEAESATDPRDSEST